MTNKLTTETTWADTTRIESWAGEVRVNMIRLVAIVLFYGRHLIDFFLHRASLTPAEIEYHTRVTWVTGMWAAAVIYLHWRLSTRRVPGHLKYVAVAFDAVMITLLCVIAGGPRSPLVLLYFPLIATAPLRLCLRLVYAATAAAMAGYLCVLAYYAWYVVGFRKYYAPESASLRIPRSDEIIFLLALLVCGLLAGQVVRQARRLAAGYPVAVVETNETTATSATNATSETNATTATNATRTTPENPEAR